MFLNIINYNIHHLLIDNESLIDILFYDVFSKMNIFSDQLGKLNISLIGFTGDTILVEGVIILIRAPSACNTILGRLGLNAFKVVVSIYYLLMKFSTRHGVREVCGDQMLAQHC